MNVFSLYLSNIKHSIIAAWHRIKMVSGRGNRRESNNDDIYCMYIFTYLRSRQFFINIF